MSSEPFFSISRFIYEDASLTCNEKMLYGYFHCHFSHGNQVFVSNAKIAQILSLKIRQSQEIIASLINKGYVRRSKATISGKQRRVFIPLKFGAAPAIDLDSEELDMKNQNQKSPDNAQKDRHAPQRTLNMRSTARQTCAPAHPYKKEDNKDYKKAAASKPQNLNSSKQPDSRAESAAAAFIEQNLIDLGFDKAYLTNLTNLMVDKGFQVLFKDVLRFAAYFAFDLRQGTRKANNPPALLRVVLLQEGKITRPKGYMSAEELTAKKKADLEQRKQQQNERRKEIERKNREEEKKAAFDRSFDEWKNDNLTEELVSQIIDTPEAKDRLAVQRIETGRNIVKDQLCRQYFRQNVYGKCA